MKNKDFLKLYKSILIILIIAIITSLIYTETLKQQINSYAYNISSNIIGNILEEHKELEEEIIQNLNNKNKNFDLEKYGITKNNITDLTIYRKNTTSIIIAFLIILFSVMALITIIYFIYLYKFYNNLKEVNNYIKDILCNKCINKIADYNEGIFSILKNDISKIAIELVRNKENLEKDKKYLEETLSDISHQLKTPLTSMYMINDILEENKLSDKEKHEFLERNRKQLERIEWLVTSLLKLSKLESGTVKLKMERTLASTLISDSFLPLKIPYELKKQEFNIEIINDTYIIVDKNWTREAIINILKNAHEHTLEGGKIIAKIDTNPIYTEISITDNGCGISKQDLRHIFERFYRSSSTSKDSVGIGLNMAKNIIERENGIIEVTSKKGEGTTFTIKFYKVK